jgi:2-oxoisovalerate ferredoxin oxidoreductase delta subunit
MADKDKREPVPEITIVECKGCGRCVVACPKDLLTMSRELNERGYHYAEYAGEGCTGCANCFYTCPEPNALRIRIPERKTTHSEED